jgi:two-component system, LytTR family, response regulator
MNPGSRLLQAYLIDDEPLALRRLARLLEATERVEIVASTTDPEIAIEFLNAHSVDAVFLDIQMPGVNGFDLLRRLSSQPMVIFTTAYDQYALRAFEVNSIDYLLKPVEPEQLDRALNKLERWKDTGIAPEFRSQFQALLKDLAGAIPGPQYDFPDRVPSRVGGRVIFIELERITHFAAEDKLTYAVTPDKRFVVDYSISELERRLDRKHFVRIHRSTLLNLDWLGELHTWFAGQMLVKLKDQKASQLTVARDRARHLKEKLGLVSKPG